MGMSNDTSTRMLDSVVNIMKSQNIETSKLMEKSISIQERLVKVMSEEETFEEDDSDWLATVVKRDSNLLISQVKFERI